MRISPRPGRGEHRTVAENSNPSTKGDKKRERKKKHEPVLVVGLTSGKGNKEKGKRWPTGIFPGAEKLPLQPEESLPQHREVTWG